MNQQEWQEIVQEFFPQQPVLAAVLSEIESAFKFNTFEYLQAEHTGPDGRFVSASYALWRQIQWRASIWKEFLERGGCR